MTSAHSAPPHKYTYLAADLLTGVIRDEIPFSNVEFSRELNKAGGFEGTVSINPGTTQHLTGTTVPARVTLANLQPNRTIIWVLRNSVPVWGGIIWGFDGNLEDRVVKFAGQDFFSYWGRRTINSTVTFSASTDDQFSIVNSLITTAQAVIGGNIGTTVAWSALSGIKRDRTYWYFERMKIAEAISNLAQVDRGFDFAVDYAGSQSAGLTHALTLSYPRRGRVSTNIILDARKNVRLLTWAQDGADVANKVYAQGAGEGDNMLQTSAADTSKLSSYPLLEDVTQHKDVSITQTIIDHAQQDLRKRSEPVETMEVEVLPDDVDAALGSFIVGDTVRSIAKDGFFNVDKNMRVMGYTVGVNDDGLETMRVRLASAEGTI